MFIFAFKAFNWLDEPHPHHKGHLYLKSTNYRSWPHLQNTLTVASRLVLDQTTGHRRLAKLTYKINHCIFCLFKKHSRTLEFPKESGPHSHARLSFAKSLQEPMEKDGCVG